MAMSGDEPDHRAPHLRLMGPAEARIRQRQIFRRSTADWGDAVLDVRTIDRYTVIIVRGEINEHFPGAELAKAVRGPVLFDLLDVGSVTSFGVREWLRMLAASNPSEAYFVWASDAIIRQVSMIRNFRGSAQIYSVAPDFVCSACSTMFASELVATWDRTLLQGTSLPAPPCPACGQTGAECMSEDLLPSLGLAYVTHPPPDIEAVVHRLRSLPRHRPVEKRLTADETRLRFCAPITRQTRFDRVFAGLEGAVTLDLRMTPEIDQQGLLHLERAVEELWRRVRSVRIEGCPIELLRSVVDRPGELQIASVVARVADVASGIERKVVVDLRRWRHTLLERRPPAIHLPWCKGAPEYSDLDLLQRAAERYTEEDPPDTGDPAPPEARPRRWALWLPLLALAVLAAMPPWITLMSSLAGPPTEAEPGAPRWIGQGVVRSADTVQIAGSASAETQGAALDAARSQAWWALVQDLRRAIGDHELAYLAGPVPLDAEGRALEVAHFQARVGVPLQQVDAELSAEQGTHWAHLLFELPVEAYDALHAELVQTAHFRGLTVAETMPWSAPGLVVIGAQSWFGPVSPGDRIVAVDAWPTPTSITEFTHQTAGRWPTLASSGSIEIRIEHIDQIVPLRFQKRPRTATTVAGGDR